MAGRKDFDTSEVEHLLQQAGLSWRARVLPALEAALQWLPEQDEMILHLSFYQQASDAEIATLLALPGGAEAVSKRREEIVVQLAGGSWARALTRENVEVLLEMAGETGRLSAGQPLSEADEAAAKQALQGVFQQLEVPVAGSAAETGRAGLQSMLERLRLLLERLRQPGRPLSLALVIPLVLLALYGVLWLAGQAALPDTYRLASVDEYEERLNQDVRGIVTPESRVPTEALQEAVRSDLAEGVAALLAARQSTLGLFQRYNQARVERAIQHLEPAFFEAPQQSFLRAQIAFLLAKAYLMQEDTAAARTWLDRGLAQNVSAYREETEALLQALDMR